jgi:NAD(P)H-hydrate epimerase
LKVLEKYDLIIDAIFGYSFKGELRAPFDSIISALKLTKTKIVSVDLPSGWDVDEGNTKNTFTPGMLISLTLPKLGAKNYEGLHFLGGRFVPKRIYDKYKITALPNYASSDLIIKL